MPHLRQPSPIGTKSYYKAEKEPISPSIPPFVCLHCLQQFSKIYTRDPYHVHNISTLYLLLLHFTLFNHHFNWFPTTSHAIHVIRGSSAVPRNEQIFFPIPGRFPQP